MDKYANIIADMAVDVAKSGRRMTQEEIQAYNHMMQEKNNEEIRKTARKTAMGPGGTLIDISSLNLDKF